MKVCLSVASWVCVRCLSFDVTYCSLFSSVVLKPSSASVFRMAWACFVGVVVCICVMPAFSKKGLYRAMTAVVSTHGVPHWPSVSRTSCCPKPMVRYFGCTTMRMMLLRFWLSCAMGILCSIRRRPVVAIAG